MAGCKILLLLIVFQVVNSKPLLFKEVKIKKNFDFSFKPPPFKPITLIKEKWTKFGHFATKHVIAKRSPFELAPIPEKNEDVPMFKVSLEKSLEAGPPLSPLPPPPPPPPSPVPPMFTPVLSEMSSPASAVSVPPQPISMHHPVFITPADLSRLPVEDIIIVTPVPPPPPPVVSVPSPASPVVVPTPIKHPVASPAPVPIPGPLPPLPPPPPVQKGVVQGNLLTDIARVDEINAYLKAVEAIAPPPVEPLLEGNVLPVVTGNSIEAEVKPPPVDEKLNSSPLVKGSRLALYFGNILLQVMSEVISSARSAISQYSQPAPI